MKHGNVTSANKDCFRLKHSLTRISSRRNISTTIRTILNETTKESCKKFLCLCNEPAFVMGIDIGKVKSIKTNILKETPDYGTDLVYTTLKNTVILSDVDIEVSNIPLDSIDEQFISGITIL